MEDKSRMEATTSNEVTEILLSATLTVNTWSAKMNQHASFPD